VGIFARFFRKQQGDSFYEKRHRPRLSCSITTELSDPKGDIWICKIVDMSESGFGISTGARLRMGHEVNIIRPSVEARVVWAADNKAGLSIIR
jgi:hypothetical protein